MDHASATLWLRSIGRSELHELISAVKQGDADAQSRAVVFVTMESFGMWHNRTRAKLCRYFKNHPPDEQARRRLVDSVIARLLAGNFSEQFKDQLAMAIRFDRDRLAEAATLVAHSQKPYVRRYASWIQQKLATSNPSAAASPSKGV